jgi:hypothetical protein
MILIIEKSCDARQLTCGPRGNGFTTEEYRERRGIPVGAYIEE